jgi:peptide/nickel transport system permease protein
MADIDFKADTEAPPRWRLRMPALLRELLHAPAPALAAGVLILLALLALAASWIAASDPFDPANASLVDSMTPPAWLSEGSMNYLLGTDDQGRDILSTVLYGLRVSLAVGATSVLVSMTIGVSIGLLAGSAGGWIDSIFMRIVDIQLTIPSILLALMIDGVARVMISRELHSEIAIYTIILAIGVSNWPPFARVARSRTLVERNKEYVQAARIIGVAPIKILFRHILPNILAPILVIATIDLGLAILSESALSFLGVGMPPTQPSLGTLIRTGGNFLFSGSWWIFATPALALVLIVLSVNVFGDWLRDALNPKLRKRV